MFIALSLFNRCFRSSTRLVVGTCCTRPLWFSRSSQVCSMHKWTEGSNGTTHRGYLVIGCVAPVCDSFQLRTFHFCSVAELTTSIEQAATAMKTIVSINMHAFICRRFIVDPSHAVSVLFHHGRFCGVPICGRRWPDVSGISSQDVTLLFLFLRVHIFIHTFACPKVGTRDDVWAARVKTSRGDVLRIYEFDRFNETAFQVHTLIDFVVCSLRRRHCC